MISYEYDAEAEKRAIVKDAQYNELELMKKMYQNGMSFEEALEEMGKMLSPDFQPSF